MRIQPNTIVLTLLVWSLVASLRPLSSLARPNITSPVPSLSRYLHVSRLVQAKTRPLELRRPKSKKSDFVPTLSGETELTLVKPAAKKGIVQGDWRAANLKPVKAEPTKEKKKEIKPVLGGSPEFSPSSAFDLSTSSAFDLSVDDGEDVEFGKYQEPGKNVEVTRERKTTYRWSSANFKISPRKLNMLAKQIRHLPINEAITQMEFSQKRASKRILNNLAFARKNMSEQEVYKMDPSRVVVAEAFVGKGQYLKRTKIQGRGRFGIMHHPKAHIKFILKELPPRPERLVGERRNIRGWKLTKKPWVPLVEDKPIYNVDPRMYDKW